MTRLPLILCAVVVLAFGLGACSSSYDGFASRAQLAADVDDYCSGQVAYSRCAQQRFAAGAAGFRSEDSYAPGQASSLAAIGQQ